ncbi:hypothetical protein CPB83DRAFT_841991 [Crepidotus variabilis]|uniref:Uncharacterized protein n=1 Tax=Crepidotus variabilis TaxID=179855 RepID=A0A9P6EU82_9AGAR|nr:hypothetical protein CPB83DRAFT_841991 [Crepidotus variabilis]
MMLFHRRETPWEVVDSRCVAPTPIYYQNEELELEAVKQADVKRKYVLDVRPHSKLNAELKKAVVFARDQLLSEVRKNGYNLLLLESWHLTLLRRGKLHRIEVEYTGRPARTPNQISPRPPPFMAVLQHVATLDPEPSVHVTKKQSDKLLLVRLSRRISVCSILLKN